MTTDSDIIARCEAHGVDRERLERCLDGHDNWGKMVHAFEYYEEYLAAGGTDSRWVPVGRTISIQELSKGGESDG